MISTAQKLVTETPQPTSITFPNLLHQLLIRRKQPTSLHDDVMMTKLSCSGTGQLIENPINLIWDRDATSYSGNETASSLSGRSSMSISDLLFQLRLCISPLCRDALHRVLVVYDVSKALAIPYREVTARPPVELLSLLLHSAEAWTTQSQEKAETRLALVRSFIVLHSLDAPTVTFLPLF